MNKKLLPILLIVLFIITILVIFKEKNYSEIVPKDLSEKTNSDSLNLIEDEKLKKNRIDNTVSATTLMGMYIENEVNADNLFLEKTFYVEGTIDEIGKDILDKSYITLKTNEVISFIQCYVDDNEKVSKLRKGDKVTVYGKCKGMVIINILIENGKLVDNI